MYLVPSIYVFVKEIVAGVRHGFLFVSAKAHHSSHSNLICGSQNALSSQCCLLFAGYGQICHTYKASVCVTQDRVDTSWRICDIKCQKYTQI